MPRSARLLQDGGYYHIFTRGNNRRKLFETGGDYSFMRETIQTYLEGSLGIMHYCLMPNHLHIVLRANQADKLPVFMKKILQVYAAYFRKRHDAVGHVFQNRYSSKLINNDPYLLRTGRYTERNPLRARLVDDLSQWRWSSYHYYAYSHPDPLVTLIDPYYLMIDSNPGLRQEFYQKFLRDELPYDELIDKTLGIG